MRINDDGSSELSPAETVALAGLAQFAAQSGLLNVTAFRNLDATLGNAREAINELASKAGELLQQSVSLFMLEKLRPETAN